MQDLYKTITIDRLKQYVEYKNTYKELLDRIKELNEKKTNITVRYGDKCVKGGGSSYEDKLLNINAEIEMLENNYLEDKNLVETMDKALNNLSKKERDIVINVYGKYKKKGSNVEELKEKYYYGTSQIYNIANYALKKLSMSLFGKC